MANDEKDDAAEKDPHEDEAAESTEEKAPIILKSSSRAKAKANVEAKAEEADADDESDESEADDEDEEADDGAAAERVAKALGVEEGADDEEEDEAKEPEAAPNRAARRREEALERRRKRRAKSDAEGASARSVDEDDEALPKDRNARAKALLKKRRESASKDKTPINLLPGEMVDDAFARSTAAAGKWIRANFSVLQWIVVAAVLGGVGFLVYRHFSMKSQAGASDDLIAGVVDEDAYVLADDKRPAEEKENDPAPVFKTIDDRENAALASYKKVTTDHAGTGAAILARLGEAGVLFEKRDYAGAIDAYQQVLSSPLAAADLDVKGRTIEGLGLAKEGKGDADGAMAEFKDLEGVDVKGMKELAEYHQARLFLAKGDKDKAKELLKKAHDALGANLNEGHAYVFLPAIVDILLKGIDPNALPPTQSHASLGGAKGPALNPEDLERIKKQLMDAQRNGMKKQQQEDPGHEAAP